MPRIDPNQLLRCLSVLLSQNGGIKSKDEVARIVSLMTKFSKKLVSKCIYVLILKTTEADLLDMFMSAGGWDLTNNWLNDSIQIENWPLVLEIVELLLLCPVDLERLKGNNCPKAIKMLSKDAKAPEKVRLLASNVVEQWLAVVKSSCEATTSQAESPQGAHSEEEMEEDGDYAEEEESEKIQAPYKIKIVEGKTVLAEIINDQVAGSAVSEDVEMKEIDSEKTKNTSESKRSSRKRGEKRTSTDEEKDKKKMSSEKRLKLDLKAKMKEKERQWAKEKEKEREKEREKQHKERAKQEEKDKAVLSKLMTPTLTHVGKIPKKSKDDKKDQKTDDKPKKSEPVKPPPQPKDPKKYNISVEIRKGEERPKTVKTFNSKFRSTGLEELPPPPKKKTDGKKSEEEKKPVKVKEEKKSKEEEKEKIEKEKIEKTPPKPKVLQESDVFADALTAANPVRDVKKKKRRPSNSSSSDSTKKENASSPVQTKTEKPEDQKPVFKFYQDTLITSEDKVKEEPKEEVKSEKLDESIEEEAEADFPQFSKAEIEDEVAKAEEAIDEVLKREEKKNVEREKNRLPTGVLTYIKKTSSVKKGVQWKPDDQLESVRYFELDETERVNVTKAFSDMKQMERTNERLHLQRKLTADDVMEEKTVWRPLIPVDIIGEIVIPGKNSLEKEIQQARERTTLQAIYFDKSMIPDSPAEPDLEIHSTIEPTIIPLDDQTGNPDSVISYKTKPWPEPKGYEPGMKSHESPPQMAFQDVPPMLQQPPMMGNPQFGPGPGPFPNVPFMPGQGMMPGQEWMVNGETNMMNDNNMMMMGMNPGMPAMNPNMPAMNMPPNMMPPGMMGPPEMFQGPPDMMPPFFGPNPGMFGPRPGGPFQGNNGPPMQDNMRNPRPWFNKQNGGPPGGGGSWRHPNKNNMKGGNNWKNKGICNNFSRKGFCRVPNCQYKHIKPNKNR